jgi:hypothetical protein
MNTKSILGGIALFLNFQRASAVNFFADKADRQRLRTDNDTDSIGQVRQVTHQFIDNPRLRAVNDKSIAARHLETAQTQGFDKDFAEAIEPTLTQGLQIFER